MAEKKDEYPVDLGLQGKTVTYLYPPDNGIAIFDEVHNTSVVFDVSEVDLLEDYIRIWKKARKSEASQ